MIAHKIGIAAVLLGIAGAATPLASAAPPQPGAPCSPPTDTVSADGTLSCSGQSRMWMHRGLPIVQPGTPCDRPGDVTYRPGENLVTCRQSGSGLTWQ
jgi:hypothetical protein